MTDGEDDSEQADGEAAPEGPVETFERRLDGVATDLDSAETESALDAVEAALDEIEADIDDADLPETDEEDADDPEALLADRIDELRDQMESQRGPYLSDVTDLVGTVESTIRDTRWTDNGEPTVVTAVETFLEDVVEIIEQSVRLGGQSATEAADALAVFDEEMADVELDPDEDAATITSLLTAAETLEQGVEDAEEWDDLEVRAKLQAEGFYDVLEPELRKDFPPEWNAVKIYEKQFKETGDPEAVEMILLAYDLLESEFMEENIFMSLGRIGPEQAFDAVHGQAQRRNKQAIDVLGKIGDDRAVETLVDFIDGEGDPALQVTTLRALGAIGSEDATRAVADRLVAENADVRSAAARALGRIGDTRAIEPLEDVLESDDEDSVRASAAWALNQIGTERARKRVQSFTDDRSYLVQSEAQKATSN
jgi:HEAT repeat protein